MCLLLCLHTNPLTVSYLSVSKVIEDSGQFFGVGILSLADNGGVWIPPVNRESMEPHFILLQVKLPQTGVKTVDLTP